ncbi:hypothetical protein [Paraburkholderia sp. HD33-4]|uniref:hypothetical protein n=1 Tax=Paraburkholderia sp. HD33-4 TaxID=2883242 RepID=UPI001F2BB071|nr:hypothetical protein [Paraburkholderia sp. HD33-4]
MNTHIHRAEANRARLAAERIYIKLQTLGTRQVRLYQGMLLTYPYPARRGYGTRGLLIGIYTLATRLEWIEDDVSQLFSGDKT